MKSFKGVLYLFAFLTPVITFAGTITLYSGIPNKKLSFLYSRTDPKSQSCGSGNTYKNQQRYVTPGHGQSFHTDTDCVHQSQNGSFIYVYMVSNTGDDPLVCKMHVLAPQDHRLTIVAPVYHDYNFPQGLFGQTAAKYNCKASTNLADGSITVDPR